MTATSSGARRCADMDRSGLFLATGLSISGASPGCATAPTKTPTVAYSVAFDARYIDKAAQRFELPGGWIRAALRGERGGNPRAASPDCAIGSHPSRPRADAVNPRDNIRVGAAYLRQLYDRYDSICALLVAYNNGQRAMRRSLSASLCRRRYATTSRLWRRSSTMILTRLSPERCS
ncbi:transglycosylase SLT domain-containing protein [Ancylobacter novellus]|uniref:transglycosylase SLT domain-containing protein n=1 Tax=Ancylobacter novellus TaxID=921 RepID=UPI0009D77E88